MSEIITFAPTTAGGGNEFVVPFPYLSKDHVKLYVNGVEDTGRVFTADGTVRASVAITAGDTVVVKRQTPRAALITTLPTSGPLSSDSMNEQSLQAVYVATEAADGLREGLALDEATETYWEAAPYGINRRIKNVVDPSAAQEAITKGWYDAVLQTHVDAAEASATAAAASAASAAADAASASSAATAAAADAALADAANAIAQAALGELDGTPQQWADAAEDWAQEAEDTLVIAASGGNEVDEYSAFHWAQKSSDASVAAAAAQVIAEAAVRRIPPWASQDLLGDEEGFAVNWIGQNISIKDYGDASKTLINKPFIQAQRDGDINGFTPSNNDVAQFQRDWTYGNHSGDNVSTQWWDPTISEKNYLPYGKHYGGFTCYSAIPHEIGNGVYFVGSLTGLTRNANASHNSSRPINDRNCTRLLADSSTGFHRLNQTCGRSGNNVPAGMPLKLVFIAREGTHNEAYLAFYDNDLGQRYGCQIDLSNGTWSNDLSHFDLNFTDVDVIALPGGIYRYDCLIPATTNALDFNFAYSQVGLRSGASYSWTSTGTESIFVDYMGVLNHHSRGTLVYPRIATGSGNYRFDLAGPAGSLNDAFPTTGHLGYCTWWSHRYFSMAADAASNDKNLGGWGDAASGFVRIYREAASGNVKVYLEDSVGANETWDTGLTLALNDTDNNRIGTKFSWVLSIDEDAVTDNVKLWYRVNDGSTVALTYTFTTVTASGNFSSIDGSTTYHGTDNVGNNVRGFLYVADGYFTRPANLVIANRYLGLFDYNDDALNPT